MAATTSARRPSRREGSRRLRPGTPAASGSRSRSRVYGLSGRAWKRSCRPGGSIRRKADLGDEPLSLCRLTGTGGGLVEHRQPGLRSAGSGSRPRNRVYASDTGQVWNSGLPRTAATTSSRLAPSWSASKHLLVRGALAAEQPLVHPVQPERSVPPASWCDSGEAAIPGVTSSGPPPWSQARPRRSRPPQAARPGTAHRGRRPHGRGSRGGDVRRGRPRGGPAGGQRPGAVGKQRPPFIGGAHRGDPGRGRERRTARGRWLAPARRRRPGSAPGPGPGRRPRRRSPPRRACRRAGPRQGEVRDGRRELCGGNPVDAERGGEAAVGVERDQPAPVRATTRPLGCTAGRRHGRPEGTVNATVCRRPVVGEIGVGLAVPKGRSRTTASGSSLPYPKSLRLLNVTMRPSGCTAGRRSERTPPGGGNPGSGWPSGVRRSKLAPPPVTRMLPVASKADPRFPARIGDVPEVNTAVGRRQRPARRRRAASARPPARASPNSVVTCPSSRRFRRGCRPRCSGAPAGGWWSRRPPSRPRRSPGRPRRGGGGSRKTRTRGLRPGRSFRRPHPGHHRR